MSKLTSRLSRLAPAGALCAMLVSTSVRAAPAVETNSPWRAHEALGLPWLRFGLDQRSRFERLDNDFRAANPGDAGGLLLRTLVTAELRFPSLVFGAELEDSRAYTLDGTPLNVTVVNALELLQAYVGLRAEGLFAPGDSFSLNLGRFTMDVGGRRVVARNDFRNTINGFAGFDAQWTSASRDVARAFVVMPVARLPAEQEELEDNRRELDRDNLEALFVGLFAQTRPLIAKTTLEMYLLGLRERDSDEVPTANRRLLTPGVRALRVPSAGSYDFQLEAMAQLGTSRASVADSDTKDLDHRAFCLHASTGYRFAVRWEPRVVLQYDLASGDADPKDGKNGRFDLLFGARRFEFGPSGLYGAIARSNVSTPGLRLEVQPLSNLDAMTAYRLVWLASSRDAWTTAALRDPSGDAGSFVGQQLEARVRWHVFPKNVVLAMGGALFLPEEFARSAPKGSDEPSVYVYSQLIVTL